MKRLLFALVAAVGLSSCLATRSALNDLSFKLEDASVAAIQAKQAAENPDVTQAELDAAMAVAIAKADAAKAAAEAVPDAVADDIETAKKSGLGTNSAIGLGMTALAWYLRDRRKRRGGDPLQNSNMKTPPTNLGGTG